MRNYWIKIAVGAVIIFVIGIVAVRLVRSGSQSVRNVVEGSGPISIPLPSMVPFKLDQVRLGSVRRLTIYRSAPKTPSHVGIEVQLTDSVPTARLASCILTIDHLDNIDEHTSFRCAAPTDTVGQDLVPFGTLFLRNRPDSFVVLLPAREVHDLTNRGSRGHFDSTGTDSAASRGDSSD